MGSENGRVNLLCRQTAKRVIMERLAARRPQLAKQITRVSREALDRLEAWLMLRIDREIDTHPSKGTTFKVGQ